MILDRLVRNRKSRTWEEIREDIIKAIEEEKRTKEPFISISSVGTYPPPVEHRDVYTGTAADDEYPFNE